MRRRAFVRVALAAPLAGSALAARAAAAPVRFLTVRSESGAAPIYAAAMRTFERAGVDVAVSELQSGAAVLEAVIGGSAEIGVSNPVSLAEAYERGVPLACVAPTVYYSRASANSLLMVAKSSPIRSARDLDGKTVAVNGLRNTPELAVHAWVDANGGDAKSLRFIEIPFSSMGAALERGQVAAAFFAEPMLSQVRDRLRVLGDAYGAVAPKFYTGAFFAMRRYAAANAEIVARIAAALDRTAAWANAHPAETAAIMAKLQHLDVARVEATVRSIYAERLEPRYLQPPIDLAVRYGVLAKPLDAAALVWRR